MGINRPMKDKALFRSYLKNVHKIMTQGDAREESFYSSLEDLINAYAQATTKEHIHVTTLPKRTEAGNPDFRIWDGNQHIRRSFTDKWQWDSLQSLVPVAPKHRLLGYSPSKTLRLHVAKRLQQVLHLVSSDPHLAWQ